MALDLETMLAPVSDDQPAGPDLAYDHERQQIEQAFEAAVESAGSDDDGPDWRAVLKLIESQFSRTKDIWLAVYVCRAGAKSGSLDTVELGAQALAGLFERYWDTAHPQLEELGLPGRKAPCDSLASRGDFLLPLERTVLIAHPRLGAYTGADIERFRSEREAADGYGLFRAALEELGEGALQEALGRLSSIEEALRRADKIFTDAAAGEPSPNYAPTYAHLAMLKQALGSFLASAEPGDSDAGSAAETAGAGVTAPSASAAGPRIAGRVENREDVIKALDAIADYYRRMEPSHPMQQLAQRARHWVTMDFMSLMRDIAPDGMRQVDELLTKREE
jgi:type VI secretion system protein ImpA